MVFTARGNAAAVPHLDGQTPAPGRSGRQGAGASDHLDGEGSRAVELCIRAALGERANEEQWLISAVKLPARWVVSFLVSPDDRLGGYTWCGPAHQVRSAIEDVLRGANLGRLTPAESLTAAQACQQPF